jgi:N-acetylmuramoyl-L-alanine amidase
MSGAIRESPLQIAPTTIKNKQRENQFYLLKHTVCPAVLTENFFMDNETDCRYIMSGEGRQRVADMHAAAIKKM